MRTNTRKAPLMEPHRIESDSDIVARVPEDRNAFAVLVRRYEAALLRYVRRLGVYRAEDREDIVQGVFLKAYRGIRGYDPTLSLSAWLYRIAHNETMSWFRANKVRPEGNLADDSEEALSLVADEATDSVADAERAFNAREVAVALAQLEPKHREVLVLRYFEELDYRQISDILQIPEGSVATLLHRAKKQLSKKLVHLTI